MSLGSELPVTRGDQTEAGQPDAKEADFSWPPGFWLGDGRLWNKNNCFQWRLLKIFLKQGSLDVPAEVLIHQIWRGLRGCFGRACEDLGYMPGLRAVGLDEANPTPTLDLFDSVPTHLSKGQGVHRNGL